MPINNKINKLGIFDSGVGGLSVLNALKDLPIPEFLYFADTANLPYGTKTPEQIIQFTTQAVEYLQSQGVDAVVIACHTAATIASPALAQKFPTLPLFNVADPAVECAVKSTQNNKIGVIATPATVASGVHKSKILEQLPTAQVFTQPCPKLVPLIESGAPAGEIKIAVSEYVTPLLAQGIDTLIIGCTHYELIKEVIGQCVGDGVVLVSSPALIRDLLQNSFPEPFVVSVFAKQKCIESTRFVVTGNPAHFEANLVRLFNASNITIESPLKTAEYPSPTVGE